MATILLQAAGAAVGTLVGGPVGGMVGRALGALGGAAIDNALFAKKRAGAEGARLTASRIQEAQEGTGIPRLYGTARITGQLIWTTWFEEEATTERQGGKGGSAAKGESVTTYSYFGNFAVGLCEGPVALVRRVWADGEELDLSGVVMRVHDGAETQEADPLIEAKQGLGNAPSYRGLAYVVFERLPLAKWGNRLPQISCEVVRPVGELERRMRAVTIIPGATEHGLDPQAVTETLGPGSGRLTNRHTTRAATDFEASLDELVGLCPNLERAALVVSWFADDLRVGSAEVRPGVEMRERAESETWRVGPTGRAEAHLVSESDGGPAYGGTPSDAGVVRAVQMLKARGLKVTYYPFLLMDVAADNALPDPYGGAAQAPYPWRGRMTLDAAPGRPGSADGTAEAGAAIGRFVGAAGRGDFSISGGRVAYSGPAEWSFRRMVLHQAHLAKLAGGVDAFVIGSEMRGLTRLRDAAGRFPFVDALVSLAADVKAVLPDALVTYAADWSEYFGYQPADGSGDVFFNLDPLWAHPAIGAVGVDNYLPIADWRDGDAGGAGPDGAASLYDLGTLRAGISGGENFDWYYAGDADRAARQRTPITDGLGKPWVFRSKDVWSWWANPHRERRGGVEEPGASPWVPRMKPIWFTELGCAAIDKGANQPNVFLDPKSAESAKPYFSTGGRDDAMQRRFVEAHLGLWDPAGDGFEEGLNPVSPVYGGRMVDPAAIHLWTWDARPYPAFPALSELWRDGSNWRQGHWLTGRLGRAPLDGLIRTLLADHGFTAVDTSGVEGTVGGYLVAGPGSARAELEELMRLAGIAAHAAGGRLVFRSLGAAKAAGTVGPLVEDADEHPALELRRTEDGETPEEVVVGFLDAARDYQPGAAGVLRPNRAFPRKDGIDLPVVLEEAEARRFAAGVLSLAVAARETARFALPPTAVAVEPGDAVRLPGVAGRWLVTRIESGDVRRAEARLLPSARPIPPPGPSEAAGTAPRSPSGGAPPFALFLDLPLGMDEGRPEDAARITSFVVPPVPLVAEASVAGGPFETRLLDARPATLGETLVELGVGPSGRRDRRTVLDVRLYRGALFSVTRERLLAGGNLAAVRARSGVWEVLQFERAEEIAPLVFRLSGFLRGQGGTEDAAAAGAAAGASFVRLDAGAEPAGLRPSEIGMPLDWRVARSGGALDDASVLRRTETLGCRAVSPLAPAHLRCRFAADGAIRLAWVRRTRVGGDGWEGLDVPLGEEIERYAVSIEDGEGRALAVESDGSAATVSAGEQVRVFGRLPPEIAVRVAQVSLRFGAGTAARAAFRRPGT